MQMRDLETSKHQCFLNLCSAKTENFVKDFQKANSQSYEIRIGQIMLNQNKKVEYFSPKQ